MHKYLKRLLLDWLPPALINILQNRSQVKWYGNYSSWAEAQRLSSGYNDSKILEKVKESTLKVKNGKAVYERDSFIFNKIQYSWPVLAGLMWIANRSGGNLNIIDFGGSLGTTFFQNKKFIQDIPNVQWNIVEQDHFVSEGKLNFENDAIKFFSSIEYCMKIQPSPNTILLSGVIQYIEDPYNLLNKIKNFKFEHIIFDRTSFMLKGKDRITIQKTPKQINASSYPCWFFNSEKFLSIFKNDYEIMVEFDALAGTMYLDNSPAGIDKGFILRRKK